MESEGEITARAKNEYSKRKKKKIQNNLCERHYRLTDEKDMVSVRLNGEGLRPSAQATQAATHNGGPTQAASIRYVRHGKYENGVTRHKYHRSPVDH